MSAWTVKQLLDATRGKLIRGKLDHSISRLSIDSRRVMPGEAFVAIRGQRFDGHQFIQDAVHRGASCLIASSPVPVMNNGASRVPTILVDDTTQALADLARFNRRRFTSPVVAVTGSCGKTTTKDLAAHLLGGPEVILKNPGTQNNHIGLPLALLELKPSYSMAVVELGSNHPGEISQLVSIAEPTVALITNVGPAHLEFFGSLMEVLHEKLSLLEGLAAGGTAILPGDQLDVCLEAQRYLRPGIRSIYFGTNERCDVQAVEVKGVAPKTGRRVTDGQGMGIRLRDRTKQFVVPLMGYHNVENTLAALSCAWALGIPLDVARERLASFQALPLRSEVVRCNGVTILNDCYNANPLSFARALEMLRDLRAKRKLAIVGDMLELGSYAPAAHQAIGRLATQLGIDEIIAVGEFADFVAQGVKEKKGACVRTYRTVPELLKGLPNLLRRGDGLLVKGSRRLNLEQVTDFLLQYYRR